MASKPPASGGIGENPLAQARAVQSAVAVEAVRSELGHDIDQRGLAGSTSSRAIRSVSMTGTPCRASDR